LIAHIRISGLAIVLSLCGVALIGAVVALSARGADEDFLLRQENPSKLRASEVEELMLTAPDPQPPHEPAGTRSRCSAEGKRDLRNPWRCTVEYRSGSVAHYSVTINADGSYLARYSVGTATARGCCLDLPGADN
jgi:hypothetical protein